MGEIVVDVVVLCAELWLVGIYLTVDVEEKGVIDIVSLERIRRSTSVETFGDAKKRMYKHRFSSYEPSCGESTRPAPREDDLI